LALIIQSLSKLGIDLSTLDPDPRSARLQDDSSKEGKTQMSADPLALSECPDFTFFDINSFETSTEMLDAFSSLQPIDATVGSLSEFY